jgi:phosphate transport system substrate-binding protein
VLRPDSDIDKAVLKQMSPTMRRAVDSAIQRNGMYVVTTDQDAADAIESVPGSIGRTALAIVRGGGAQH